MANSKRTDTICPVARTERLLVTMVGDEAVIYDQETKVGHALASLAAAVFTYANGENTPAEIAELASYRLAQQVTEEQVTQAVEELSALGLLDSNVSSGGLTRRDTLKIFGAVGAGTMLVSSVAAPFAMAASVGDNYLCGTGDNPVTGTTGGTSYPQVWEAVGDISVSSNTNTYTGTWTLAPAGTAGGPVSGTNYDLDQPCYITAPTSGYCEYQTWEISTSDINNATQCETLGFYWNQSSQTWVANAPAGIDGQPSGQEGYALCVDGGSEYYNVPEGVCNPSSWICVNSENVYDGHSGSTSQLGSCPSGDKRVILGSNLTTYQLFLGTWVGSGGTEGVYQCLPCDGKLVGASYQCCEVVCAPADLGGVMTPASWSPSTTTATGPGSYTLSACQIWGGTFCSNYAAKWCTDNECNTHGTCTS